MKLNPGGVCLNFTSTIHTTWWDVTTLNNLIPSTVYCVYLAVQWNLDTLKRSPMGQKKEVCFYKKMYGGFSQMAKKVAVITR